MIGSPGDDPMTGAQISHLKSLSEQCAEQGGGGFQPDLTKAEASKRIDALKAKRRPGPATVAP